MLAPGYLDGPNIRWQSYRPHIVDPQVGRFAPQGIVHQRFYLLLASSLPTAVSGSFQGIGGAVRALPVAAIASDTPPCHRFCFNWAAYPLSHGCMYATIVPTLKVISP